MAHGYDTMMNPAIEQLLDEAGSKFSLVILSAMRSREITNYVGQLGQGIGAHAALIRAPGLHQHQEHPRLGLCQWTGQPAVRGDRPLEDRALPAL